MTVNGKGFLIALNPGEHIIRIRAWGYWDITLTKKYGYALTEKTHEMLQNGRAWQMVIDFRHLYPRSEDIQRMLREYLEQASSHGIQHIVYLGDRATLQIRLDRFFQEMTPEHEVFMASDEETPQGICNHVSS
ncbi:hypothetical protein GF339_00425 [candidate division KSB3 bacterium]|uniref:Uncharacterized protein n=1 Tax=candidate division KSB3 bacterium TaxID=2044937 RepID=A0A9D5JS59_9BACT|nr:hypothetical protein [candidate division KSB3 bacterium]MBD3323014.1 hypothetical protein [candidate division KSB3 bacterium]